MNESNVVSMSSRGSEAEDILRAVLSKCAEIRARGAEPRVLVMSTENGQDFPSLGVTSCSIGDLAGYAAAVNGLLYENVPERLR